jgi:hypothetical protein
MSPAERRKLVERLERPLSELGFDLLLVGLTSATVVFGMLWRQVMLLTAFATGMLLIRDAWFDLMTAGANDFRVAILTAALGDLALAAILITGALRLIRFIRTFPYQVARIRCPL